MKVKSNVRAGAVKIGAVTRVTSCTGIIPTRSFICTGIKTLTPIKLM
jgi:hypothetical protein